MKLPTEITGKKQTPDKLTMLIYGDAGIGKSTFCSQFPNALFLATERGLDYLDTYQVPITELKDIIDVGTMLKEQKNNFKTIVIDTLDMFYNIVRVSTLKTMGITHESEDNGHGRVYSKIYNNFANLINLFLNLNYGVIMTSHCSVKQDTDRLGNQIVKVVPSVPEKALAPIIASVPLILYLDYQLDENGNEKRCIRTQTTKGYTAKDRTGLLPDTINLNYKEFVSYFKGENK